MLPMWIADYIGIEYETMGRGPEKYDCFGLVIKIQQEVFDNHQELLYLLGDSAYDIANRPKVADLIDEGKKGLVGSWGRVETPKEGDIVIFNVYGKPSHVGVMVNKSEFIHVEQNGITEVDSIRSGTWKARVEGFYRHR